LAQYKEIFGENPPGAFWSEYNYDSATGLNLAPKSTLQQNSGVVLDSSIQSITHEPSKLMQSLRSYVKLCFTGQNGNSLVFTVKYGDRFANILHSICLHQKQSVKNVELTYRGMVMRNYMTPYNLNLKDGDVIQCNVPIYSPEEIAANVSESSIAAADSVGVSGTATILETTGSSEVPVAPTSTVTTNVVTTTTSSMHSTASNFNAATATSCAKKLETTPPLSAALYSHTTTNPPATDKNIKFRVRDQNDKEIRYSMERTVPMLQFLRYVGTRSEVEESKLRLYFKGVKVSIQDTPDSLEMKDGDVLHVDSKL